MSKRRTVVISCDGSGDYSTLTAAVAVCSKTPHEPVCFLLRRGVYAERPFLELDDYILEGEGANCTVLTAGAAGRDPWPGEEKTGTFRSQTLFLGGGTAEVRNLRIENTAGDGADRGQAVAVYADAARVKMVDVTLYGNQDTLFTAPLPSVEREKHGFRGPRENAPRLNTKQYYLHCTIRGNVDFIFGGAEVVFDGCRIEPLAHKSGVSYITAPSTPAGQPGYLFYDCTVAGNCPTGTVYLGRPWRGNAACYWLDCTLSSEISPDGWDDWSNPENRITARFGESGSKGVGVSALRAFGSVDNATEATRQRERLVSYRSLFGE